MNPVDGLINSLTASTKTFDAAWGRQMAQANKYDLEDGEFLKPADIAHFGDTRPELFTVPTNNTLVTWKNGAFTVHLLQHTSIIARLIVGDQDHFHFHPRQLEIDLSTLEFRHTAWQKTPKRLRKITDEYTYLDYMNELFTTAFTALIMVNLGLKSGKLDLNHNVIMLPRR